MIAGSPDTATEQATAFFDGLIFNMPDAEDLEPVRLAGRTLTGA